MQNGAGGGRASVGVVAMAVGAGGHGLSCDSASKNGVAGEGRR